MELLGTIYWIYPAIDVIQTGKSEVETTSITVKNLNAELIEFEFTYKDKIRCTLRSEDGINYQGYLFLEDEEVGKVFSVLYKNDKGCLLIGDWVWGGYDSTGIVKING